MKIKLQFAILVGLLVFLGTYLEKTTVHNQQIVIQFSDSNISSEDAFHTIDLVKKQLQNIGVTNIQIGQRDNGKLKITYYSIDAIERIQDILGKENGFKFDYESPQNSSNELPENKSLKNYELNISEIQTGIDINWGFEGIQIVELNQESDRYDTPNVNTFVKQQYIEYCNGQVTVAINVNKTLSLALDTFFYKIPEVRAGPIGNGII